MRLYSLQLAFVPFPSLFDFHGYKQCSFCAGGHALVSEYMWGPEHNLRCYSHVLPPPLFPSFFHSEQSVALIVCSTGVGWGSIESS